MYQSCGAYPHQIVHQHFTCTICKSTPILGTRWFCFECRKDGKEFNLCSVCKIMTVHAHSLESIKYNTEKNVIVHKFENDPREPNDILQPIGNEKTIFSDFIGYQK